MKLHKFITTIALLCSLLTSSEPLVAQSPISFSLNEQVSHPAWRIGQAMNRNSQYAWLVRKNLLSFNGGLQPQTYRAVYNVLKGTTDGFTADIYDAYSSISPNQAVGWYFEVKCKSSSGPSPGACTGGAQGCKGTIRDNSGPATAAKVGPTFTFNESCKEPLTPNDSVYIFSPRDKPSNTASTLGWNISGIRTASDVFATISSPVITSPNVHCTAPDVGKYATLRSSIGALVLFNVPIIACLSEVQVQLAVPVPQTLTGGKLSIDSEAVGIDSNPADQPPMLNGFAKSIQCLRIINVPGQTNGITTYLDSTAGAVNQVFAGPYTMSADVNVLGGGGLSLAMQVKRGSNGGIRVANNLKLDSQGSGTRTYSTHFNGNETSSTTPGAVSVSFTLNGAGAVCLSNLSLQSDLDTNPTVYKNSAVEKLKALHPGIVRYNGVTEAAGCYFADLIKPAQLRPTCSGYNQSLAGFTQMSDSPQEIFQLAEYIHAPAVMYTLPLTMSDKELADYADYLGGASTTVYGGYRAALRHPATWNSTFPGGIFNELGNEIWNAGNRGVFFPLYNSGSYWNYIPIATSMCGDLKASPNWDKKVDYCIASVQQVTPFRGPAMINEFDKRHEIDGYDSAWYMVFGGAANANCTTESFVTDTKANAWLDAHAAKSNIYLTARYAKEGDRIVAGYEGQLSTTSGPCTQPQLDGFPEGEGAAGSIVVEPLYKQNIFPGIFRDVAFTEYARNTNYLCTGGLCVPHEKIALWGAYTGNEGTYANLRPWGYAMQMVNAAIGDGTWEGVAATNVPTFDHSASNGVPAGSDIPYLDFFAIRDKDRRCAIINNSDISKSYTYTITGANSPAGAVTQTLLSSPNLTDNNEAPGPPRVVPITSTMSNPASFTIPAHSLATECWKAAK